MKKDGPDDWRPILERFRDQLGWSGEQVMELTAAEYMAILGLDRRRGGRKFGSLREAAAYLRSRRPAGGRSRWVMARLRAGGGVA